MDAAQAFARYEEVRARLPSADFPDNTVQINSLLDIADQADVFVFDAYGVLNVGEGAVTGAAARIEQLRALGKQVFVLSNSASQTRDGMRARFRNFGFSFSADEIVSSRDAALDAVAKLPQISRWGVIASKPLVASQFSFETTALGDTPHAYHAVDGILFLGAARWNDQRQTLLEHALRDRSRPLIIANPDLVAPRETGLSLDPGYYGHALADVTGIEPVFLGKPFAPGFDRIQAALPGHARIVMVGDTLHTDILGAAAQGWRTVLVTGHGVFAGQDVIPFITKSGIRPHWQLGSI